MSLTDTDGGIRLIDFFMTYATVQFIQHNLLSN